MLENGTKTTKVIIGLSGGVDSSVGAILLKEAGYDVTGVTMQIYGADLAISESGRHACYGPGEDEDIEAASALCKKFDIPYYIFDLRKEFEEVVLKYFRTEYLTGRTPNPCIVCNQQLKFGFLVDRAKRFGIDFDYFATGHYVRIVQENGAYQLHKARDRSKDQSYFLYALPVFELANILFPIGELTKTEVREIAAKYNLDVADQAESQDFIAGGDYSVLFEEDEVRAGDIIDENGQVFGQHKGLIHYTVGQRKGLGISHPRPLYVLKKDPRNNHLIVTEHNGLFVDGLIANNINLFIPFARGESIRALAKIRQGQREFDVTVSRESDQQIKVLFDFPNPSVAPGQSIVLYDGDRVLGGGVIVKPIRNDKSPLPKNRRSL